MFSSVTTSLILAQQFEGFDGIIMQLNWQWTFESQWNLSKALPVEWRYYYLNLRTVSLFYLFELVQFS